MPPHPPGSPRRGPEPSDASEPEAGGTCLAPPRPPTRRRPRTPRPTPARARRAAPPASPLSLNVRDPATRARRHARTSARTSARTRALRHQAASRNAEPTRSLPPRPASAVLGGMTEVRGSARAGAEPQRPTNRGRKGTGGARGSPRRPRHCLQATLWDPEAHARP